MIPSRTIRLVAISLVLVGTAGCDQATKHLARTELGHMGSITFPGRFIEFTLAENAGAFLSLGASLPDIVRAALMIGVSVGLALLLAYLIRAPELGWLTFLGLALIWAGGVSNLIDRFLRKGVVTDFMVVRAGPLHTGIFNLADFTLVVGMLMVAAALSGWPAKLRLIRRSHGVSREQAPPPR
jgi:signal peptidase II